MTAVTVAAGAVTTVNDTTVTIAVPAIAQTTIAQSVVYTVKYTNGTVNTAPVYVLPSSLTTQLAKVTNAVVSTIPFGTVNTQVGVEAAMLTLAQAAVSTGFTVSIEPATSVYNTTSKIWIGKFIVTDNASSKTIKDAAFRTLTIGTTADPAGAITELAKVTDAVITTVPFGTENTQAAVEAAMLKLANATISTGYTTTIAAGSTYSTVSKVWTGKLIVTNNTTAGNTKTDAAYRTITVVTAPDVSGATAELAKITNAVVTTVPFGTLNTQAGVEAAMLTLAQAAISSNYTVTIAAGSTYSTVSKVFTGKFVVTNNATAGNTITDAAYRSITVATGADASGAVAELAKITDAVVTTVPFGTANTQAAVEAAMLTIANATVSSGYTVTIAAGSTYSTVSKVWAGKFIVTNNTTAGNTKTDAAFRSITVVTAADIAGATAELAKISNAVVTTVPFGTANTQAAVETAMLTLAQAAISSDYTVTIAAGSTYSTVSKVWTGKFIVTNNVTAGNTITDAAYRTITVATGADTTGAATELAKVTNAVVSTLPVDTANTQAAVEAAMLTLAQAAIDSNYTVTIAAGSTYSTVSKAWTGKFIVTNNTTSTNTKTDAAYRTFLVTIQ